MKKTLLIGSGIVNLVSAYVLSKKHYKLVLVDKAPNPLTTPAWNKSGCTFGGENVRMFTYTEADNYNEKGSQLYSGMGEAFEKVIGDNGWLIKSKETLNEEERAWIRDFHAVSPQDARQFAEDIYQVNIDSGLHWRQWMSDAPELFENVDLVDNILRIYSDPSDFQAAQKLHGKLGSLTKVLSTKEALERYPFLSHAHQSGMLGGCMLVRGFTLKIHDFCQNIITLLESEGAEFRWETEFTEILKDSEGKVTGVVVDGKEEHYHNYVLSLGAYAGTSLYNTQTNNQLHGVLGVWMTLPNVYPSLKYSIKIHKTGHVGEDTNVTLIQQNGRPVIVLGSGYGYTGNVTENQVSNYGLSDMYESLKHTAQTYFPEAYKEASSNVDENKKYCIRPWTPTGLGVFETIPTSGQGQLIITGGNNTGGFTQSPYIAKAVESSLAGEYHPLHKIFSPQRMGQQLDVSCI